MSVKKKTATTRPSVVMPPADTQAAEPNPVQESALEPESLAGGNEVERSDAASQKPPYDRSQVISLAVQLVSAQLVAASQQHNTARTIASIEKISADYFLTHARLKADLKTLQNGSELTAKELVDVALMHLSSAFDSIKSVSTSRPLDDPSHDHLFTGAVARVQSLLMSPTEDKTLIFAEQIFHPNEEMSEHQVGNRFSECSWPGLKNRADFHQFMVRLENWIYDYLKQIRPPDDDPEIKINAEIQKLLMDSVSRGREECVSSRVLETFRREERRRELVTLFNQSGVPFDANFDVTWVGLIVSYIFCGRVPSCKRDGKKGVARCYNPWGLFRFLRIHSLGHQVAMELLAEVTVSRNELAESVKIYSIDDDGFGALQKIDDLVDQRAYCQQDIKRLLDEQANPCLVAKVKIAASLSNRFDTEFQKRIRNAAKSGDPFDFSWQEGVGHIIKTVLLAGLDRPFDIIEEFLKTFYLPLLASYCNASLTPNELEKSCLLDIFPENWHVTCTLDKKSSKKESGHDRFFLIQVRNPFEEERSFRVSLVAKMDD